MTTNRLRSFLRTVSAFVGLCPFLVLLSFRAEAQQPGAFNFSYTGPFTFPAGPGCSRSLESIFTGNTPINVPTVTSTIGANITVSMYSQSGSFPNTFNYTDLIPAPYTITVGWFVQDDQGNSHVFQILSPTPSPSPIKIIDNVPPVFDLTNHPMMLSFNSSAQVPPPVWPPFSDNCGFGNPLDTMYTQTGTVPPVCSSGTFTRTWKVKDFSENQAVFTQTIKIFKDTLPPVVSFFPQNGSAPCSQIPTAYPAWIATQMANFTATDPSGINRYENNAPQPFPPGCTAPVTVKFTAVDNCGLRFSTTAVFTSFDNAPPVVVQEPRDTVGYCSATNAYLTEVGKWIKNHGYLQAYDSCSSSTYFSHRMKIGGIVRDSAQVVAALQASFSGTCTAQVIGNKVYDKVRGKVLVEFLVKDACGNEGSIGEALFGVIDTVAPIITGTNIQEECGGGNDQTVLQTWINVHGNASVTDECSNTSWTNFSWTTSTGATGTGSFNTGPYPGIQANNCAWWVDVTFRATDDCGNIGSKKLRFQIKDVTKPVFPTLPTLTFYCPNTEPASPSPTLPATDNCDASLTYSFAKQTVPGTCSGNYQVRVTFTATDDCGNTATAIQQYDIRDTIGPVFTLVPAAKTFRCDTFALPGPPVMGMNIQADDPFGCSVVSNMVTTQVISGRNPDPALCGHYTYPITRIFTVKDDCGNTATASQVLQIVDNQAPAITGFLDTMVACEALLLFPPPTSSDACGSPVTPPVRLSDVFNPGPCTDSYSRTWTWQSQDVCGNKGVFEQEIMVRDTARPVILSGVPAGIAVECNTIPVPPSFATFTMKDNCDVTPTLSFVESEIRDPNTANCDHWANYVIRREWKVTDNCGNTRTYTQNIQVQDNSGPVLTPISAIMLPADQGVCGANVVIPAPLSVFDLCTALGSSITLRDTAALVNTTGLPNNSVPVDTVVFQWPSPNLPPAVPVLGNATLKITVKDADTNSPTEFLKILGEGNTPLGQTANTATDCSGQSTVTVTIPANNLNAWLTDGQLVIRLVPQGIAPVNTEVNATCPNGKAFAELTYQISTQQTPVSLTYRLDSSAVAPFPPSGSTFLSAGQHTVVYTATDCAGNSNTASTTLTVQDLQPPQVTAPPKQTYFVGTNNCQSFVTLPFPAITDNCDVSGMLIKNSAIVMLDFVSHPDVTLIPKDVALNISGLIPNAVGSGKLKILFRGNNSKPGQFFKVLDENNTPLGNTVAGTVAGDCSAVVETTLNIPAATLNTWATNGVATFALVADDNFADAINPCGPQVTGPDGVSSVQAVLMYSYGVVNYEILNAAGTPIQSGLLTGSQTTTTLTAGNYKVKYSVADDSNIVGMTMFNLTVRDTVRPVAKCKDAIIDTYPNGKKDTIHISNINNASTDNCSSNLTYSLSKSVFSCLDIPQNPVAITLTVTDSSGNTSTCSALIQIKTATPTPTYDPVCDGGMLKLYANPPVGGPYSYSWTGPNGYMNGTDQNPVIPNAQKSVRDGTYTVQITGVPGCTASGNVTVNMIAPPPKPDLQVDSLDLSYCLGNNIVLSTTNTGAQYEWYELMSGNPFPTLLGTTVQPNFTINQPSLGQHTYLVRATGNNCTSQSSDLKTVTVNAVPIAMVEAALLVKCEGESLTLGAVTVAGSGALYRWEGPTLMVNAQYPAVTNLDSTLHAGFYTLTVYQNGCRSLPAVTEVRIKKKPAKPILTTADATICEGATVTLLATQGGAEYRWKSPTQTNDVTTSGNFLTFASITSALAGDWRVAAFKDGCESIISDPLKIEVQRYPDVATPPIAAICAGDTLRLSATSDTLVTWTWTGPGFSAFEQNPKRFPGVTGIYKVVGTTSFGCKDSAFVTAQVTAPPIVTVTNDGFKCLSGTQTIHLTPTVVSPNGPFTYMWTGPNDYKSSDQIATIPNATSFHTGPYNLKVKDSNGCVSQIATTNVTGQDIPVTPQLLPTPEVKGCPCENITLSVSNTNAYSGNVTYLWNVPGGGPPVSTATGAYTITCLNVQNAGKYSVVVQVDSCISLVSAETSVIMKPQPNPPTVTSNSPVCSGQTISLNATPVQGATYFWKGPNNTSHTGQNWGIMNADSSHAGFYYCSIEVDGCKSPLTEGTLIAVKPTPKLPFAFTLTSPLCLGQPSTMKLELDPNSTTSGAQYQWFKAATNEALGPASPLPFFQTTNLTGVLKPGDNKFYVIATLNGCTSGQSQSVSVLADTIPNSIADAGLYFVSCDTAAFILKATQPTLGGGIWSLVSGSPVTIVNPNSATTPVRNPFPGSNYVFRWTISAGACLNYSTDTVSVKVSQKQTAISTNIITDCNATSVQLNATQGQPIAGFWSQEPGQSMGLGVVITDSSKTNTSVGPLTPGNVYFFNWNIQVPGCPLSTSSTVVRSLSPKPFLGPNVTWCSPDSCFLLKAPALLTGVYPETGRWYSPEPTQLKFGNPTSITSTVCNLKPGSNIIIWETNGGFCGLNSRDTIIIVFGLAPVLQPDEITTAYGTPVTINVLLNDVLPITKKVTLVSAPSNGTIDTASIPSGIFIYQPKGVFSGTDEAFYKVCNFTCPDTICDITSVTFTVLENKACEVPTVITPNDDNLNDRFVVRCQQGEAPNLELTVFNQWGDEVYHAQPYEGDWEGTYNGEQLPVGTYYVILNFGDGTKPYTGFLLIQR